MNHRHVSLFYAAILAGLCITLVAWLSESWSLYGSMILGLLKPGVLALILILSAAHILLGILGVWIILTGLGYRRPITRLFLIWSASLAANYPLPFKFGIPLRIGLTKKSLGVPLAVGTSSVALETYMSVMSFAVLTLVGSILSGNSLAIFYALLPAGMLVIFIAVRRGTRPGFRALGGLAALIPSRAHTLVKDFHKGVSRVSVASITQFFLLALFNHLLLALRLGVILYAFGYEPSYALLVYVQSVSYLLGYASLIPAGLGVRDASIGALLVGAGIPVEVAVAAALIERMASSGLGLLIGIVSSFILGVNIIRDDERPPEA